MNKLVKYIFLGFLAFSVNGFSQEGYSYKRKIELKKDAVKWNSIEIPDKMYNRIKPDLSDIRIFRSKGNDTVEVRYTIHKNPDFEFDTKQQLKIINQSVSDNKSYFTVEAANQTINQLGLKFQNENFDWKVNLEGSHDQNQWFTILKDYRILSIHNSETNYRFEDLSFNDSDYKYYRISVDSKEKPIIKSVHSNHSQSKENLKFRTITVDKLTTKTDKKNKVTTIEFSLKNPLPVYAVSVNTNKTIDYNRTVTVEYVQDSIKTEKGFRKHYSDFSSGILSSERNSELALSGTDLKFIKDIRITIDNKDNQPLEINSVTLKTLSFNLLFSADDYDWDYYLYYGNKSSSKPSYDAYYFNNVEQNTVSLSNEIQIQKTEEIKQKPLFENKLWLWGIMVLIIGGLGYFSVKMISKKE